MLVRTDQDKRLLVKFAQRNLVQFYDLERGRTHGRFLTGAGDIGLKAVS